MLRAIYSNDVRYDICNVFEFDAASQHFHMITDKEMSYPMEVVMNDTDWLVFVVGEETSYIMETKNRLQRFND